MDYFYEVKQLIKCTGDFDFHNYIQQFSHQFSQICIEKPEEFTKSKFKKAQLFNKTKFKYLCDNIITLIILINANNN